MAAKQKIIPFFWYDSQAEEAANFYVSIFPNSSIDKIKHQGDKVLVLEFNLDGQQFVGLNGGPVFTPNPSISQYVICDTAEEVEEIYGRLS